MPSCSLARAACAPASGSAAASPRLVPSNSWRSSARSAVVRSQRGNQGSSNATSSSHIPGPRITPASGKRDASPGRHSDLAPTQAEALSAGASSFGSPEERELMLKDAISSSKSLLDGLSATLSTSGWQARYTVVGLCFIAFMLCNLDRVNMSIAILPMAQQYGWDAATMGLVNSSFFWGYLLTQVAGGVWADRFGGKLVLGFGVAWWSLATMFTPIAAQMGLPALLAARAAMGLGEGVAMPAMNAMMSKWVPRGEKSRSLALVYSGMFCGSILGLGLSPQLVGGLGWPSVFYIFGSLGVAWFFMWQRSVASSPAEAPPSLLAAGERDYILANLPANSQESVGEIPWAKLLSRKEVWAIIVSHFCHNWGLFILLTWMPSYYSKVLGLDLASSGILSVLPWVAMALVSNFAGWLADWLVARGTSVTLVRKGMQTIGFLGPAFFLSRLSGVTDVTGAVLCMVCSQGLDAFSQAGLYANHQDIGPKYAGVLMGLSNTAGVLAGVLGSLATGYILQHGSWDQVWSVAVGLYLVGTVVWNLFSTGERIFD